MFSLQAQNSTSVSKISVSGEGAVKIIPNIMILSITSEITGNNVVKVKEENDEIINKALAFLKKMKIAQKDIKTQRLSLYPRHDYEKKKDYNVASQSINITLRDLSSYEKVMEGLMEAGINKLDGITYESSKIEILKAESRKLAMLNARKKAEDFANALGQKVGKAISISEHYTNDYNVQADISPASRNDMLIMGTGASTKKTISVGEVEVKSYAEVIFILE